MNEWPRLQESTQPKTKENNIITIVSDYALHCFWLVLVVVCTTIFLFVEVFLCPCMAINTVSVQYNGRLAVRLVSHMRSSETHVSFSDYLMCFFLFYCHALAPFVSFLVDPYLV